jgi:hypothetical protein
MQTLKHVSEISTVSNYRDELLQIGAKLIELRKKKGYRSHVKFTEDFNLARVQYWRMEKGRTNFTIKSLAKVLMIHGVSLEEFFKSLK